MLSGTTPLNPRGRAVVTRLSGHALVCADARSAGASHDRRAPGGHPAGRVCGRGRGPSTGSPRAYLRDVSPYLTRLLLRAGFSANGVTWLMIISGALAAVATGWPGLAGAVLAVLVGAVADAAGLLRRRGGPVAADLFSAWGVPGPDRPLCRRVRDRGGPRRTRLRRSAARRGLDQRRTAAGAAGRVEQGRERSGARVAALRRAESDAGCGSRPGADRRGAAYGATDRPVRAVPPRLPLGRAVVVDLARRAYWICGSTGWRPRCCWSVWSRPRPSPWSVTWRPCWPPPGSDERHGASGSEVTQ